MVFDRDNMKATVARLANQGVWLGTSSWKYPGWRGQLYTDDRYVWHGKYSESRFERLCLSEYAEVFKTVCVDAAYYRFPDQRFLDQLMPETPEDFRFAFKVTDQITLKQFPNLPRFGPTAGRTNPDFLNSGLFESDFLAPLDPWRNKVGLLMFEFSHFSKNDFERGREFAELLESFLSKLPRGWPYGVEIRNRTFLQPDYFDALTRRGAAHIYNSWEAMPPVLEQMALPGSRTNPGLFGARLLLRPGRRYEDAVKMFSPYSEVRDEYQEGRAAGAKLIQEARQSGGKTKGFIFVNNRFEGNALHTIAAMIEQAGQPPSAPEIGESKQGRA